jgi:hypothetical protein
MGIPIHFPQLWGVFLCFLEFENGRGWLQFLNFLFNLRPITRNVWGVPVHWGWLRASLRASLVGFGLVGLGARIPNGGHIQTRPRAADGGEVFMSRGDRLFREATLQKQNLGQQRNSMPAWGVGMGIPRAKWDDSSLHVPHMERRVVFSASYPYGTLC